VGYRIRFGSHRRDVRLAVGEQDAASIAAVMTLRARFAQGDAGAVVAVFDAMIRALTGGERRH
jgi:hypothetical protein